MLTCVDETVLKVYQKDDLISTIVLNRTENALPNMSLHDYKVIDSLDFNDCIRYLRDKYNSFLAVPKNRCTLYEDSKWIDDLSRSLYQDLVAKNVSQSFHKAVKENRRGLKIHVNLEV